MVSQLNGPLCCQYIIRRKAPVSSKIPGPRATSFRHRWTRDSHGFYSVCRAHRFLCPFGLCGPVGRKAAGTRGRESPGPWHFSLFGSSTAQEQGDAVTARALPMPLDCCGARGACRQSGPQTSCVACGVPACPPQQQVQTTCTPVGTSTYVACLSHAIGPKRQVRGAWGQGPQDQCRTTGTCLRARPASFPGRNGEAHNRAEMLLFSMASPGRHELYYASERHHG